MGVQGPSLPAAKEGAGPPAPLVARTSRRKALYVLPFGPLVIVLGIHLTSTGDLVDLIYGVPSAACGLALTIISIRPLTLRRPRTLRVDASGVRDERIGAGIAIPWDAVRKTRRNYSMFEILLHDRSRYLVENAKPSFWLKINRFFGFCDAGINAYGLDRPLKEVMHALLAHHNAWKRNAIARGHTTAVIPPSTNSN